MIIYDIEYYPGLLLDLYLPEGITGLTPAIICVRGGGWKYGDKERMAPVAQKIANAGYAGISIQYRVAPEYIFPCAVRDIGNAVEFVRGYAAQWSIDPTAIGLFGRSAGGHLVSWVGAYNNPVVQAVVSVGGVYDLVAAIDEVDSDRLQQAINFIGHTYEEYPDKWLKASPIIWVKKTSAPLLMIHGGEDIAAPISNAFRMFEACNIRDAPAQAYYVANKGHGELGAGINLPLFFYKSIFGR